MVGSLPLTGNIVLVLLRCVSSLILRRSRLLLKHNMRPALAIVCGKLFIRIANVFALSFKPKIVPRNESRSASYSILAW
jgi:hypothetical protein